MSPPKLSMLDAARNVVATLEASGKLAEASAVRELLYKAEELAKAGATLAKRIADEQAQRSTPVTVCSECGHPSKVACTSCWIDFRTMIYVCPTCRDRHEEKCPAKLRERLAK